MDKCIESLGEVSVDSTQDAINYFWEVEIDDEDGGRTATSSHHGLCRFLHMPVGLLNAPNTFQVTIDALIWEV